MMERAEYLDKLLADFRPEDAQEVKQLVIEEIDDIIAQFEKSERERAAKVRTDQTKAEGPD